MGRGGAWLDGRGVVVLFAATVVLPAFVLAVLAYRSLESDRQLAERAWRERLDDASRRAAQDLERRMGEVRTLALSLAGGRSRAVRGEEGVFHIVLAPAVTVEPQAAFAWIPDAAAAPPLPAELGQAMARETQGAAPRDVAASYSGLLSAAPARWHGWIHLRRAGALAKAGDPAASEAALRRAAELPDAPAGFSTQFAARFELASSSPAEAARLYQDMASGRWQIEKSPYAYYEPALHGLAGDRISSALLEAERARQTRSRILERVQLGESGWLTEGGISVFAFTAKDRHSAAVLVTEAKWNSWLAKANDDAPSDLVIRFAKPMSVWAEPRDPAARQRVVANRRRLLFSALLLVAGVLVFGSFATLRLVRRELKIAQLQTDFAATVSHEFRSPLTGIRQLGEMLLAGRAANDEARRRQYYELICRESGRLTRLVENVLDFSRLEQGGKEFRFTRIDTGEWLSGLAGVAAERRVLETMLPSDLPAVNGDREALSSAVLNLLDNAIKYSPEGEPVEFRATGANGWVTIEIRDHGCGIAADDQRRIFDRFYRGSNTSNGETKGVGLGLALVKRIADAHGARIRVESVPGQGSAFYLSLKAIT